MPNTEKVSCSITYEAKDNPKCKILVNGKAVHDFVGSTGEEDFLFEIDKGPFDFKIVHYGKDMKNDTEKFIELKAIYFNDIDFKNKIWETTQVAEIPAWQRQSDFKWDANLYLGHNGYIEYKMESPVIDFLLES